MQVFEAGRYPKQYLYSLYDFIVAIIIYFDQRIKKNKYYNFLKKLVKTI